MDDKSTQAYFEGLKPESRDDFIDRATDYVTFKNMATPQDDLAKEAGVVGSALKHGLGGAAAGGAVGAITAKPGENRLRRAMGGAALGGVAGGGIGAGIGAARGALSNRAAAHTATVAKREASAASAAMASQKHLANRAAQEAKMTGFLGKADSQLAAQAKQVSAHQSALQASRAGIKVPPEMLDQAERLRHSTVGMKGPVSNGWGSMRVAQPVTMPGGIQPKGLKVVGPEVLEKRAVSTAWVQKGVRNAFKKGIDPARVHKTSKRLRSGGKMDTLVRERVAGKKSMAFHELKKGRMAELRAGKTPAFGVGTQAKANMAENATGRSYLGRKPLSPAAKSHGLARENFNLESQMARGDMPVTGYKPGYHTEIPRGKLHGPTPPGQNSPIRPRFIKKASLPVNPECADSSVNAHQGELLAKFAGPYGYNEISAAKDRAADKYPTEELPSLADELEGLFGAAKSGVKDLRKKRVEFISGKEPRMPRSPIKVPDSERLEKLGGYLDILKSPKGMAFAGGGALTLGLGNYLSARPKAELGGKSRAEQSLQTDVEFNKAKATEGDSLHKRMSNRMKEFQSGLATEFRKSPAAAGGIGALIGAGVGTQLAKILGVGR